MDFEAQKEIELVSLRNRAESAENISIDLRNQIKLIQANNYQLEKTISQLEERKAEEIERFQKKSIEETKNSTIKLKNIHKKMIQMRKEQEQLQSSLLQVQNENEQYRISLTQAEKEKNKLESELENMLMKVQADSDKKSDIADSMTKMQEKLSFIEEENNQSNSIISELKLMNKKIVKALKKTTKEKDKLENENSQLIVAIDDLNLEIDKLKQFFDVTDFDENNSQFSLKDIIQAFRDLKNGLGLKKKWDPKKITRHVIRKIKDLESNMSMLNSEDHGFFNQQQEYENRYIADNRNSNSLDNAANFTDAPLQDQIRSLQNEIDSLRNDLLTD